MYKINFWLLALIIAMPFAVFGQAKYMTVFQQANTTTNNFKVNCSVSPSSSSINQTINNITDYGDYKDYFKNSCYNKDGQLLFSVNADGIYDPTGTMAYDFNQIINLNGCGGAGDGYNYWFEYSISEIVIVPVPNDCSSYYVVFWCHYQNYGSQNCAIPRVIKVLIDPNLATTPTLIVVSDNVLNQPLCYGTTTIDNGFHDFVWPSFEIVADAPNSDGSQDIYTVNVQRYFECIGL